MSGEMFTKDNIDPQTLEEAEVLQREKGERWGNREMMVFRLAKLSEREKKERRIKK